MMISMLDSGGTTLASDRRNMGYVQQLARRVIGIWRDQRYGRRPGAVRGSWPSILLFGLCCILSLIGPNAFGKEAAASQFAVSQSGSPSYSYPLAVPPGIGGIAPKLSLSFSGGGVNGPIGYGWSLQGISHISRCPAIIAIDGAHNGVKFDSADKLCLDGQRLIQTDSQGSPLAFPQTGDSLGLSNTREYRTEKDTFVRVRAYGAAGGDNANGPAYFKVWTKSGQIYEYGTNPNGNANALISAQGKSAIAVWAVSRISDTNGNFMDFKYEVRDVGWGSLGVGGAAPGREWNLAEVQYTGNGAQAPTNKIVLEYSDRPAAASTQLHDRGEAYQLASKNVSIRRLTAVRTYVNSPNPAVLGPGASAIKVKAYKLGYDNGPLTNRSRLVSITECGGVAETKCLPAAKFTYSSGGGESYSASASFNLASLAMQDSTGSVGVLSADFNGDGRTDLLRWSTNPAENRLYLSNGDGSFTQVANGVAAGQFNITDQNLFKVDGCYHSVLGDFNGDGLPDILRFSGLYNPLEAPCVGGGTSYIYFSKGDGSFQRTTVAGVPMLRLIAQKQTNCTHPPEVIAPPNCVEFGNRIGWTDGGTFYVLDIDGDGFLDIVTTWLPSQSPSTAVSEGIPPASEDRCLTQICTRVFKGQGDGTFVELATNLLHKSIYSTPVPYEIYRVGKIVDIDFDGLADIAGVSPIYFQPSAGWRSRGDGNFDQISAGGGCNYPIDANGDGKSDCLRPAASAEASQLLLSNGTTTLYPTPTYNLTNVGEELLSSAASGYGGFAVADVNGDGRSDIIRWRADPQYNAVFLSRGDGSFRKSTDFNLTTADDRLGSDTGATDFVVGDFTGRGAVEILRLRDSPTGATPATSNRLYVKTNSQPPDLLQRVTEPSGIVTRLTYTPISNPVPGRYVTGRDAANTRLPSRTHTILPMYVVISAETDAAVSTETVFTEYAYKGLQSSLDGRGLLGFSQMQQQTNAISGAYLTIWTDLLQAHPYTGATSRSETRRGTLGQTGAALLSRTTSIYCDKTAAAGSEGSATDAQPCSTSAKIQRPYLLRSVEEGWDLDGTTLPTVTTSNDFNSYGDPVAINITTSGTSGVGIAQTAVKTTSNTYRPVDISGDNWILGRLETATVQSSVPNSAGSITTSAGTSANATARKGTSVPITVDTTPNPLTLSQATPGILTGTTSVTVGNFPTPPLNYVWQRVGTGNRINVTGGQTGTFTANVGSGETVTENFKVTVTDAGGRQGSKDLMVTMQVTGTPLAVSASPASVTVARNSSGAASGTTTLAITGGTAPYAVSWARLTGSRISVSGTTAATFSASLGWNENLTETFRATVTDAILIVRTVDVSVTMTTPPEPVLSISPPSITAGLSAPGSISRSATATASGGKPPFTYAWTWISGSGISITDTLTPTATFSATLGWNANITNYYRVRATDSVGNQVTQTISVNFTTPAQVSAELSQISVVAALTNPGTATGTTTVSASGGVPGYTYAWNRLTGSRISVSGGQVATFSASLGWGENIVETFRVTVTDSVGNSAIADAWVTFTSSAQSAVAISPNPLTVAASGPGPASGAVSLTSSGGTGGYSHSWSRLTGSRIALSGVNPATFSVSLGWGEYIAEAFRVTQLDSAGNVATSDITVTFTSPQPPPQATVTITPSPVTASRSGNGNVSKNATANVSGGQPPFTYNWVKLDSPNFTITNGQSPTATFTAPVMACSTEYGAFRVDVTDAIGRVSSRTVSAQFTATAAPGIACN